MCFVSAFLARRDFLDAMPTSDRLVKLSHSRERLGTVFVDFNVFGIGVQRGSQVAQLDIMKALVHMA